MKEILPKVVRSLDGDVGLKIETIQGRKSVIDTRAIYGIIEVIPDDVEENEKDIKTMLITGWGSVKTIHPL